MAADIKLSFSGDTTPVEASLARLDAKIKGVGKGIVTKDFEALDNVAQRTNKTLDKTRGITGGLMSKFAGPEVGQLVNGLGSLGGTAMIVAGSFAAVLTVTKQLVAQKFETLQGNLAALGKSAGLVQERLNFETRLSAAQRGYESIATQIAALDEQIKAATETSDTLAEEFSKATKEAIGLTDVGGGFNAVWKRALNEITGVSEAQRELAKKAGEEYEANNKTVIALTAQKELLKAQFETAKEKAKEAADSAKAENDRLNAQEELNNRLKKEEETRKSIQAMYDKESGASAKERIAKEQRRAEDTGIFARGGEKAEREQDVLDEANRVASRGGESVDKWLARAKQKTDRGVELSDRDQRVKALLQDKSKTLAGTAEEAQSQVDKLNAQAQDRAKEQRQEQITLLERIANSFEEGYK